MKFFTQAILTMIFLALLGGCASGGAKGISGPEMSYVKQPYVIGISDQLQIDVWRNSDLTRSVLVRPDGFITMPLMGDVLSAGRTPEELAEVISEALKSVIKTPEVTVTVVNPVSQAYQYRVRVMGQVNQPTSITFVDGMTVMDLVLAGGGVSDFGAGNRSVLNRLVDGEYKEYPVRLDDILDRGDISTNYELQPADVLTVPGKSIWRGEF
ncbi:XrtA/PEP-CTERM system exopolysaccharide export protein [Reinekea marinisedimentorum]|uniref:Polysaccharide export outer membrane protein n=1 Tax=Reinekea marinisedimentorum TaxID=230495 RepID=A0A4R3IC58_9GAMM|nr:XrtA/PEP-CTERM system exopolysaccharide export protein [Reinekea marinisedimentorum]TCS44101.1 polysaccharide export outer membrane protein [Reinekea marinisedimentorum]